MLDAHYTPPEIAIEMIKELPVDFYPHSVADFACGDGALLSAASNCWPTSRFIANDIDTNLAKRLKRKNKDWSVSAVDFLSEKSLSHSKIISFRGKVDCILINPPFSERRKIKAETDFFGSRLTAGSTMNFLLRALQFLAPLGYMIAILPDSCFISQRDKAAWDGIKIRFNMRKVRFNSRSTFKGIAASTTIVILRHHLGPDLSALVSPKLCPDLEILRGKLQMHTVSKWISTNGHPLVHTSNLLKNRVNFLGCHIVDFQHVVQGPAILVPRVGSVTQQKVVFLPGNFSVVLSDCVLAIKSKKNINIEMIRQSILEEWDIFRTAYGGTGAPYTTLERINEILSVCISARLVKLGSSAKAISAKRTTSNNMSVEPNFEDNLDPWYLLAASA